MSHGDSVGCILTGTASGCPRDMVYQLDKIFQPFPRAVSPGSRAQTCSQKYTSLFKGQILG